MDKPRNITHERATETRNRRRAKGMYATAAHVAAFKKLLQRDGRKHLTAEECLTLATHPNLTVSQREEFAAMATTR